MLVALGRESNSNRGVGDSSSGRFANLGAVSSSQISAPVRNRVNPVPNPKALVGIPAVWVGKRWCLREAVIEGVGAIGMDETVDSVSCFITEMIILNTRIIANTIFIFCIFFIIERSSADFIGRNGGVALRAGKPASL
jgi:hypothetical protein